MSSRTAALCLSLLCFHGGLCAPLNLTILHLNDHHSHLEESTFDLNLSSLSGISSPTIGEKAVRYGGFPMLTSLARELSSASDANVLKIHAGDAITGTAYYSVFKGEADATMMNILCPDTFTLGNHEFDDGDAVLADFLDRLHSNETACNTSVVSANLVPGPTSPLQGKVAKYAVKSFGGEYVAVVGITTKTKTMLSSNPDAGTTLDDETAAAQAAIDELKAMGHDKIVLATHIGYGQDLELARALSGVDVVIGGDSHTLMGSSVGVGMVNAPHELSYPKMHTDKDDSPVCVVQAWEYSHLLGMLHVRFDDSGVVSSCEGAPMVPFAAPSELDTADKAVVEGFLQATGEFHAVQPDSVTQTALDQFESQVDELKKTIVGSALSTLCLERIPGQGRSTLCDPSETWEHGSQVGQVVAHSFLTNAPTADFAIQNAGGVREDLAQGNVSMDDCFTLLPFSNTLVIAQMTGAQIQDTIEDGLAFFLDGDGSSGSYPIASGLRWHVDASQARGSRVTMLQANSRMTASWADISLTTTYSVVTNSFIAGGKDGYTTFGTVTFEDTFTEYAQALINHFGEFGVVDEPNKTDYSTQVYVDVDGCNHSATAYGQCTTEAPTPAPTATAEANSADKATIALGARRAALVVGLGLAGSW